MAAPIRVFSAHPSGVRCAASRVSRSRSTVTTFCTPWWYSHWACAPRTPRSQRRTVDAGRSRVAAMVRCPAPLALATKAFPMASVVSARRTVSSVGSRIWVRPQSPHLALRGVWVTRCAPTPRRMRVRPWPCGRSVALHPGQPMSPASSICSASDPLATTITDDVSIHACHGFIPRRLREGPGRTGALLRPSPLRTGLACCHATGSSKPKGRAGGQECRAGASGGMLEIMVEGPWITPPPPGLLTGAEVIAGASATVRDFWAWALSNLRSNAVRGMLAEYLVACAVGSRGRPRVDWDAYDVLTPRQERIEVKSAAYLQAWEQRRESAIIFRGLRARSWNPREGYSGGPSYNADVYVFAVLTAT